MFKKSLIALFLFASLASCDKNDFNPDVEQTPVYAASLNRKFVYDDNKQELAITYPLAQLNIIAAKDVNGSLLLSFQAPFPNGKDQLIFSIPAAQLKPDYVGIYASTAGAYQAIYQYQLTSTSANIFLPEMGKGTLKITKYNAKLKTIDGEFIHSISATQDPLLPANNNYRKTDITLSGNFSGLAVKSVN